MEVELSPAEEDSRMTGSGEVNNEFVINVLLHEYDTLRNEIVSRTSSRFQLVGLVAVAATIVTAKWGSGKHTGLVVGLMLGATALVGVAIWIFFLYFINRCAGRLMQIEDEINEALGCSALIWENYHLGYREATSRTKARDSWSNQLAKASEGYGKLPWRKDVVGG